MLLTRAQLLEALVRVNAAIDTALDELVDARPLDKPFVEIRLRALVELRRQLRRKIANEQ